MNETRYIISDAAKRVAVEPHVLRYWEEELELKIPRNEMGHRYYREKDIEVLKMVKTLKDKGYQLRAIKMEVDEMIEADKKDKPISRRFEVVEGNQEKQETNLVTQKAGMSRKVESTDRMVQFRLIMSELIKQAIQENNQDLSEVMGTSVAKNVVKEIDYLAREKEEKEAERFRRLDEVIREIQKTRQEVAVTTPVPPKELESRFQAKTEKKKRGFFKKSKR